MRTEHTHTFIIPAFEESLFLEECILSLTRQTIPSSIIITTSTPNTFLIEISSRYNIGLVINGNRISIADDWTFAYRQCQTKYLTIAHQDDIYFPEYTEKCLKVAESKKNLDNLIVFTDYGEILNQTQRRISVVLLIKKILLLPFFMKRTIHNDFLKKLILSFGNPISCPTVMYNREKIGEFEFSKEYGYNLDWDAWLRLTKRNGKFIYINQKLLFHRFHGESQTTIQINNNNRLTEEEKIFMKIWPHPVAKLLMCFYRMGSGLNMSRKDRLK